MRMDPYGTHQPLLVAAMLHTRGAILEMGGGYYSTPLISAFANAQRREAHTVETGAAVYEWLKPYASRFHKLWLVSGYDFAPDGRFLPRDDTTRAQYLEIQSRFLAEFAKGAPQRWSVVFIDHAPGYMRVPAIEYFADKAEFIVTHDTEMSDAYGYEPCLSTFRHRFDLQHQVPHATVVSNVRCCDILTAPVDGEDPARRKNWLSKWWSRGASS